MRSLGQQPSDSELTDMINEVTFLSFLCFLIVLLLSKLLLRFLHCTAYVLLTTYPVIIFLTRPLQIWQIIVVLRRPLALPPFTDFNRL